MHDGSGMTVTTRLSNTVKRSDGCRVVLVFTSDSPSAMLLPPRVSELASKVAIRVLSTSQVTMLLFFVRTTLCHANPNAPACVEPAWVLLASPLYSAVDRAN